jgi:Tfp pilus assembly protein PilN
VSEWISTHPDLQKRIENVQEFKQEHTYKPARHQRMQQLFNSLKKTSK